MITCFTISIQVKQNTYEFTTKVCGTEYECHLLASERSVKVQLKNRQTKQFHLVLRKSVTTNYIAMLLLIRLICNHHFMTKYVSSTTQNSRTKDLCMFKMSSCYMPTEHGDSQKYSFLSIKTYLSPWCKSHGCEFKLPLRESLVYEHHAEVVCKILSQEMPLETSVEQPDFGILSLQVGFTLTFVQIHKAHLKNNLYRYMHTLQRQRFSAMCDSSFFVHQTFIQL